MVDDPHFAAREALIDTPSEAFGSVKMQNVFPKMSKTQGEVRWGGPETLGEHTDEVLGELLNMSQDDIQKLRDKNAI